jgi:hypothetical protein
MMLTIGRNAKLVTPRLLRWTTEKGNAPAAQASPFASLQLDTRLSTFRSPFVFRLSLHNPRAFRD